MTYAALSISINDYLIKHDVSDQEAIQIYNQWVQDKQIHSITCDQSVWCISLIDKLKDCSKEELIAASISDTKVPHPVYGFS